MGNIGIRFVWYLSKTEMFTVAVLFRHCFLPKPMVRNKHNLYLILTCYFLNSIGERETAP